MIVELRTRCRRAYSLVEMLIAMGIFFIAAGGIYECATQVMFLVAKNTGINISHASLQYSLDYIADQLRASPQIVDIAQYSTSYVAGFCSVNEADSAHYSASNPATGNAIRFVRILPFNLFVPPNDGSPYTETNPQDPTSPTYPDLLKAGGTTLTVQYASQAANLANASFVADLAGARFFPRFPYLSEADSMDGATGGTPAQYPGLALAAAPALAGTSSTLSLVNPLPANIPSCNQADLVVISAFALLNSADGLTSQVIYYPDVSHMTRSRVICTGISPQGIQQGSGIFTGGGIMGGGSFQSTNYGPFAFSLSPLAGNPQNPAARGSVQVTLPVYAPNVDNTVMRRGGTRALVNLSINLPVQLRRRADF